MKKTILVLAAILATSAMASTDTPEVKANKINFLKRVSVGVAHGHQGPQTLGTTVSLVLERYNVSIDAETADNCILEVSKSSSALSIQLIELENGNAVECFYKSAEFK